MTPKTMAIHIAILACCLVHVVSLPLHPDASNFLDARILDFHQSTPRSIVQGVVDAIEKQNKSPSSPPPTPGGVIKGVADAVDKQNQPPASTPSDGSKKSSGIVGSVVHGVKEAIDKQNQPPTDGKKSSGITDGIVHGVKEAIDKQSQPPTPGAGAGGDEKKAQEDKSGDKKTVDK